MSGIAEAGKIVSTYGQVVAQKAEELSGSVKNGVVNQSGVMTTWFWRHVLWGTAFITAPGVISAPRLTTAGFTASGVQAGAAVHAIIGNIAAGSYFAILQSAGAGGATALEVVNRIIQTSGAAMAASGGGLVYFKSKL